MAIPTDELQKTNPSAKIELFEIHLVSAIHGSSDIKRFFNGYGDNSFNNLIFQSQSYTAIPIEANGFKYAATRTTLPRPTVRISNLDSTISALDNENFAGNTNPFGTPSNTTYDEEIYFIDRKTVESKMFVEFELALNLDLQNRKAPKRIITRNDFPSVGTFV
mgnify:CR=1 FL=1